MDTYSEAQPFDPLDFTADIVSAYVSNNSVPATELAALISAVHAALVGMGRPAPAEAAGPEKATSAQIRKSVSPDALVSFEDGKSYKTLRRHLTLRGLSPEAYRAKWGLPADYPMTAASYSAQRSELARSLGLGQQRRKAAPKTAEVVETVSEAPKPRGRPRKVAGETAATPKARAGKKASEPAAAE